MKEMQRTKYAYMKAGVIASRQQSCIQAEMAQMPNDEKIDMCKVLRGEKSCVYFNRVDEKLKLPEIAQETVLDIEELGRLGRKHEFCPYYAAKSLMKDADVIFMPYNYLLDPKIRHANQIGLTNAIVILDEAHNVEKMCEDSASTHISSKSIGISIRDIEFVNIFLNFFI